MSLHNSGLFSYLEGDIIRNINEKELWDWYIKYSKEMYPEEYKDMDFDISKKEWVKHEEHIKPMKEPIKVIERPAHIDNRFETKKKKHKATKNELRRREFHKIRDSILERDNYRCQECGSAINLHVHHIIEMSKGGTNLPDNLITLCAKCHTKKHKGEGIYKVMKTQLNLMQNTN